VAALADTVTHRVAHAAIRAWCRAAVRRIDLRVEGAEHIPDDGPFVIAARHFHHYYDGCALLAVSPRPLHLVVTLDWVEQRAAKAIMVRACRAAGWPVVDRGGQPGGSARLRAAMGECVQLLREGHALLIFPEAYPNIDPRPTPKATESAFLPFRPGFLRFIALAERDGVTRAPVVPVGLEYQRGDRWRLMVRIGAPIQFAPERAVGAQVLAIAEEVRRLSGRCAAPTEET
jgi:putative membrane protein